MPPRDNGLEGLRDSDAHTVSVEKLPETVETAIRSVRGYTDVLLSRWVVSVADLKASCGINIVVSPNKQQAFSCF
jgi:hypothetical protein